MSKVLNFERILCPVAESHETDEGLLYAIALARSYRAKLFVLTCSDSSQIDSDTVDAMRASIKRAVEHSCVLFPCEVTGGHLDYEFVITESSLPADSIKHEAEKQDADLIVMSSRRSAIRRRAVGLDRRGCLPDGSVPCPCHSVWKTSPSA
jgi:nucleotide-binding universal stress UspA family protein